jgi:hypothetical protein
MPAFCDRRRQLFLKELARTGIVVDAADAAGVNVDTAYSLRQTNVVFRKKWEEAQSRAIARLEREAIRRGVEGVPDIVVSGGKVVRHKGRPLIRREYSDRLLALVLRAKKPSEYGEKVDVTSGGRPVNVAVNIVTRKDKDK